MTQHYAENSVARSTTDPVQEHREAQQSGQDMPRLRWAVKVSLTLIVLAVLDVPAHWLAAL